jgi:hypothetical protein
MVKAIDGLMITAHPYGSELNLMWSLPSTLPDKYHIVIFKKKGSAVTSDEIDLYFATYNQIKAIRNDPDADQGNAIPLEDNLKQGLKDRSIFVARLINEHTTFVDMLCINGTEYHYSIFIQDTETDMISVPKSISGVPKTSVKITLMDTKSITRRAIVRILESLPKTEGQKLDINVHKSFNQIDNYDQWVTVHRASAEIEQRFMGNQLYKWNGYCAAGFMEKEVIQVTWFSRNNPDFLDELTKVFRSQIIALNRYFLHNNATEALISMLPDSQDERDETGKTLFSGMLIAVISETRVVSEEYTAPVEFNFENLNVISECYESQSIVL